MAEVVETSSINRPPDAVWSVLAEFGAISRWAPNVDHSCLTTEQSDGVGAQRRVQMGRNAFLERIVTWDPGHELVYSIEGLPPVVRSVVNAWTIDGSGDSTMVTLTSRIDAGPRPPQQMIARVIGKRLAKVSREMLTGLKHELEEIAE